MRKNLQPAVCQIDVLQYDADAGMLRIGGWAMTLDGPAETYEATDGPFRRIELTHHSRPDLLEAFPHLPHADRAGFEVTVPLVLEPGQAVETTFILSGPDGEVAHVPLGIRRPRTSTPLPDPVLIQRVAGSPDPAHYDASGNLLAQGVARLLARHMPLDEVEAFLDWGCGCGRVTRHLMEVFPGAEVHGTDIDHEAIAWLAGAIPSGEFHATGLMPPLPYEDGRFDLVFAFSVFTHLTQENQKAWLDELARVLRKGGILLATTHGEFAAAWVRNPRISEALQATGFFDAAPDDAVEHVASGEYYRATFQTAEYTRAAWLGAFEEMDMHVAALNFHQDAWVLRRV